MVRLIIGLYSDYKLTVTLLMLLKLEHLESNTPLTTQYLKGKHSHFLFIYTPVVLLLATPDILSKPSLWEMFSNGKSPSIQAKPVTVF